MKTDLTPTPVPRALDAATLDARAQSALKELLAEGDSANTAASYRSALKYWAAWFGLRYGCDLTLPVPAATVIQFVLDHAARQADSGRRFELPPECDQALVTLGCKQRLGPLSLATIEHRVSVLSKLHQVKRQPNPALDPAVREVLRKARRAHAKRGDLARGKPALTREPLEQMLATCDDALIGRRDRALLLFAWATGGRRRSEAVSATVENVQANSDGTYTFWMGASKTNPTGDQGPDDGKPVAGRAAVALAEWLKASGISTGPIFRRVRKGTTVSEPLTANAVRDIVKQRASLAGLDPAYSAHSLRSGFITEAGRQNVPLGEVMAMSGHRSVGTAMRYFRAGTATNSKAARLLGESDSDG
jgi:integrase